MSNRPGPLSAAEQVDVGRIVAGMRDVGVPWKVIARTIGMSRVQLWRCQGEFRRDERMKQQNGGMKHPGGCERARLA